MRDHGIVTGAPYCPALGGKMTSTTKVRVTVPKGQGRTVVVPFAGVTHRPTPAERTAVERVREIARKSRIGAVRSA